MSVSNPIDEVGAALAPSAGIADLGEVHGGAGAILESVPEAVLMLDRQSRIVFANARVERVFGFPTPDVLGQLLETLLPCSPGDALSERISSAFGSLAAGVTDDALELAARHKGGAELTLEVSVSPLTVGGKVLALCIIRDVSERRRVQLQVASSEARLNEAQRIAKIGSWELDILNDEHWWSNQLYEMAQIDPKVAGRPFDAFLERVDPNDRQRLMDASARALAGGGGEPVDVRLILPDGTAKVFQSQGEVTLDSQGRPIRMYGTLQDVTERKAIETALRLTEKRYREAQRIAKIGNWEWNLITKQSWWSHELYEILEEDPDTYEASFENWLLKVHPDDRQAVVQGKEQGLVPEQGLVHRRESGPANAATHTPREIRIELPGGREKIVELLVEVLVDERGQPATVIGTVHDVTDRRALETRLRESEGRYASTVELAAVGIAHVDESGRFLWSNRRFREIVGYSSEELLGLTIKQISHPDDVNISNVGRARMYAGEIDSLTTEKRYLRKDGTTMWVRITTALRRAADGTPLYDISIIEDISDRKVAEERVRYLATHDEMTGLPNRALFGELLDHAIESARRRNRQCAALFIDLDRFKIVNDSLGHEAGDQLLREMAARLRTCMRKADVVARLGGDEFVVLLENVSGSTAAAEVARKILTSALAPVEIMGQECRITASIGIALYPTDARDATSLMKHADMAMYSAKEAGKNNFRFYSPETSPMSVERLVLETHLAHALERAEFSVQYQGRVDLETGEIKGTEALLRWWSSELGTVSPAQFIPLAEDTGLIVPIGKWVLQTACEQNVLWQRRGLPRIVMSVNLSPRQFKDSALLSDIAEVLEQTGLEPELLELEITESMIMHDVDRAVEKVSAIKNLGVRLAIDDFGTGYSSLSQLKRFPIDTLKVDRSFVSDIPDSAEDGAITAAIISLGKTLGVTVVAEGVETEAQQAFLREHGCDEMQGFYFSRPCHPDAFADLLDKRPRREDRSKLAQRAG